jgi:hypothetical protein
VVWYRSDVAIRTDAEGRYCLNDLHRAAGGKDFPDGNPIHQPAFFLRNDQAKALEGEILSSANLQNIAPINKVVGKGKAQGTYVAKELIYAYAMWISPFWRAAGGAGNLERTWLDSEPSV